jgi:hypothetical protein
VGVGGSVYIYYGNSNATTLSSFDGAMQKLETDHYTALLWHLDDASGNTVLDASGNGNTGSLMHGFDMQPGGPVWQLTDGGQWADRSDIKFSSGSSLDILQDTYIYFDNSPSLEQIEEALTIEAWIYPKSVDSETMNICAKGIIDTIRQFSFRMNYDRLMFNFYNEGWHPHSTGSVFEPNQWYHIAATFDAQADEVKLYINGELVLSEIETSIIIPNPEPGAISAPYVPEFGGGSFDGIVDEVRISNIARDANEIKADYERRQYTQIEPIPSISIEYLDPYDAFQAVDAGVGGTVTNEADTIEINIPAGALSENTEITIETNEESGEFRVEGVNPIGYIYTFGPEGTTFSEPATVVFTYDDTGMTTQEEKALDVYYYNTDTEQWESQGADVNVGQNTLTITVTSFSEFIIGKDTAVSALEDLILLVKDYRSEYKILTWFVYRLLKVDVIEAREAVKDGNFNRAERELKSFKIRTCLFSLFIRHDAAQVLLEKADEIIEMVEERQS